MGDSAENGAGWDRRSDPSVRAMIDAEKRALSAEKDVPRDLDVEVIGGTYPEAYLYVGSGDDCVLLCDRNAPKWRNAVGLTPDNARKLAAALVRMADQSERPIPPGGTDPNNPIIHRPGCSWETTPYCNCGADRERLAPGGRRG